MKISRVMLATALCGASFYSLPSVLMPMTVQAAAETAATVSTAAAVSAKSTKAAVPASVRTIPGRPSFPEKMEGKVNRRAMDNVKWRLAPAYEEPMLEAEAAADTITIMGAAEASEEQMVHYIEKRNPQPKLNCSVEDIVRYYYEEAGREGIRPDIALCQALKETGFFAYGGDVSPKQNNFCGLGATGNREPGASFATPQLGVRAHIQHLMAYATQERPHSVIVDPRYNHVVRNRPDIHGRITKWTGLNGVWAVPGTRYGQVRRSSIFGSRHRRRTAPMHRWPPQRRKSARCRMRPIPTCTAASSTLTAPITSRPSRTSGRQSGSSPTRWLRITTSL